MMALLNRTLINDGAYTQQENLSLALETLALTSKMMASKVDDLILLRVELNSRLAELRSLQQEINALAIKMGIEPVPIKQD